MYNIFKKAFALMFTLITPSLASFELPDGFVSVIDVNGTVILQDSSTGKDLVAARNQVIASQLKVYAGHLTVEQHIKDLVKGDKERAHNYYRKLPCHLTDWRDIGVVGYDEWARFSDLQKQADNALKEAEKFNGIFPSIIHYIRTMLAHDPNAVFILHSFGTDTDHALAAIAEAVKVNIYNEGAAFNEEGHFVIGEAVYEGPSQLKALLKPGIHVWQANHKGWKKKTGGKVVWVESSILFDDNADVCTRPIVGDQFDPAAAKGMMGKEIQLVDTFQALTDEKYFVNLLQKAYPKKDK